MWKTRVQIPVLDYWNELSSVVTGANLPCFVNTYCNWFASYQLRLFKLGERDFNMTLKSPFRGVVILFFFSFFFFATCCGLNLAQAKKHITVCFLEMV